jgi:hypothetical protein
MGRQKSSAATADSLGTRRRRTPRKMPKTAENAHKNREAGCQKQQNKARRQERGQTATEQTENREQAQAVLLMFT